jgi:hypothetical protein
MDVIGDGTISTGTNEFAAAAGCFIRFLGTSRLLWPDRRARTVERFTGGTFDS